MFLLSTLLALLFAGQGQSLNYYAAAVYGDGIIACGLGDKIVWTDSDGNVIGNCLLGKSLDLRAISVIGKTALAVGKDGNAVLIQNEKPSVLNLGDMDLTALASFNGRFYLAAGTSVLVMSEELELLDVLDIGARSEIRGFCESDGEMFCAFTAENEIFFSSDAIHWKRIDFNVQYKGFYPKLQIRSIAAGPNTMAIVGEDSGGRAAMYFSSGGNVWSPRDLSYNSGDSLLSLDEMPQKVVYDPYNDRMVLACTGGTIFFVPACSHCNSLKRTRADTITDICTFPGRLLLTGFDSLILRD